MSGIILMGMPGAGKGTIGEYLCSKYGFTHLSSGDILRDEVEHKTKIGTHIKNTLDEGGQVEDGLITLLVLERLEEFAQSNQSFVLDGFPQTSKQLNDLNEFKNKHPSLSLRYISVIIDQETALIRMSNRMSCSKCHKIFNKTFFQRKDITCCLMPLKARPSDLDDRARKRIETFTMITEKVIQNDLKSAYSIDGNLKIDEVKISIDSFIREL